MPICIYCGHRVWPWQSRVRMGSIVAHLSCRLATKRIRHRRLIRIWRG